MARRRIRDERGAGQALVGRLLKGCLDRGVEPRSNCRGVRLLVDDGRVTGVLEIEGPDGTFEETATGGVVLATGGFEHDEKLVRTFLRGPLARAVSVPTNTGDGLRMAMRVGADLDDDARGVVGRDHRRGRPRARPRALAGQHRTHPPAHDHGQRRRRSASPNEAANYNALGNAFHVVDVARFAYVNHPAWMIVDQHFLDAATAWRGHRPPAPTPAWLIEAPTLPSSPSASTCRPMRSQATVERWNTNCAGGADPDFGRGDSHHDRAWGDPAFGGTKLGTLGPIDTAPYYAVRVRCGALGTKGGPRTDSDGRVARRRR